MPIGETIGIAIGVIAGGFFVFVIVSTLILMGSAKVAGIEKITFGRALLANFLGFLLSNIISGVLTPIPVIGWLLGLVAGFAVTAWMVQAMFDTTFRRSALAVVLSWVIAFVILSILVIILVTVGLLQFGGTA